MQVPQQPEPRHVGHGRGPTRNRCQSRVAVELRHDRDRPLHQSRRSDSPLQGSRRHAAADGLRQPQLVPGGRRRVAHHAVRVDRAGHGQPVLGLGIVDRVAAGDDDTRPERGIVAASQDLPQDLPAQVRERVGDQVEGRPRRAAHRVDVGQGVGRGDAAEVVRVVDDRREEVGGGHQSEVVAQAVNSSVVGRVKADKQVHIIGARQLRQQIVQLRGGQLARATGSM